jgi:DNA-directed RNA polymerase beta' subunit
MNLSLQRRGFSVGIEDVTPKSRHIIQEEQKKCFLQAKTVMETEPDLETRELKILSILNKATDIGERITREGLDPNNSFMHMIVSGAKGSIFNYVSAVSSVGQQNLEGRRAAKNCGGRSLPSFDLSEGSAYDPDTLPSISERTDVDEKVEDDGEAGLADWDDCEDTEDTAETVEPEDAALLRLFRGRGFVSSSYYDGLTAEEAYFVAGGGREGLIDTSVKTAKCGYVTRRMRAATEEERIGYNGAVVTAKGTLTQFCYGEDNYSASELIKTEKNGMQPSDIDHIADELNAEYDFEWEMGPRTVKDVRPKLATVVEDECVF